MIPSLPEMPALTLLSLAPGGTLPLAPAGAGEGAAGALDFAGLLGAALPPTAPQLPVNAMATVTIPDGAALHEEALVLPAADAPSRETALSELTPPASVLPTALPPAPFVAAGRNLPLPGAQLPELPLVTPQAATLPEQPSEAMAAEDFEQEDAAISAFLAGPAKPEKPVRASAHRAATMPSALPANLSTTERLPAPEREQLALDPDAAAEIEAPETDPAATDLAPALTLALAGQMPVAQQVAATPEAPAPGTGVTGTKRTPAPRMAVALSVKPSTAKPETDAAVKPDRVAKTEPAPASPQLNVAAPAALSGDSTVAPADSGSPAGAAPSAPGTVAAVAPSSAPVAAAAPQRVDPRADAPSPQQQSTIDQVGDLREALRAARPAMTLQHAEFGAVSLRLEATGGGDWRAVLASRDPGFVPAIHAALADRAVAAAAAAADSGAFMGQQNSGQHAASQSGTFDHRSGSTPNGGQGASQPYLGQSSSRDGEAAPDHRRPSTAAALAARAEADEGGSGSHGQASGGLFA